MPTDAAPEQCGVGGVSAEVAAYPLEHDAAADQLFVQPFITPAIFAAVTARP